MHTVGCANPCLLVSVSAEGGVRTEVRGGVNLQIPECLKRCSGFKKSERSRSDGRHYSTWASLTGAIERANFRTRGGCSMAYLVHDRGNHFQPHWRAFGQFMAHVRSSRHGFDTAAHHDSVEEPAAW